MPQACRKRVTSAPQARRSRDTVLDHDLLSPWLPCVAFLLWFLLIRKATQEGQGESRGQPVDHRTGCSLPCAAFLLASLLENPNTNTHRGARGGAGSSQLCGQLVAPHFPLASLCGLPVRFLLRNLTGKPHRGARGETKQTKTRARRLRVFAGHSVCHFGFFGFFGYLQCFWLFYFGLLWFFWFFWLLTRVWAAPFKTLVSNQKNQKNQRRPE